MLQRLDIRPIEQELNFAKQQLQPYFQNFTEEYLENLSSPESADLFHDMLKRLTHPMISIPLLRFSLMQEHFPYMEQYNSIFLKAEEFYFKSIYYDLDRIRNNQPLVELNLEEIKQAIQQINWKVNVQKSSILGQSQEVGENIDLMKFFEGVRNYQNWNQNIKKECLEKLKEKARNIELDLTLKRGFITEKVSQIANNLKERNLSYLFEIDKEWRSKDKFRKIVDKICLTKKSQVFEHILLSNEHNQNIVQKLTKMLKQYSKKKIIQEVKIVASQIRYQKDNVSTLVASLKEIKRRVELLSQMEAFKRMNLKPFHKVSNTVEGTHKLLNVCKKISLRNIVKKLNLPTKMIFRVFNQVELTRYREVFAVLRQNSLQIELARPNVSDRVKARFLLSLDKFEKEPLDMKRTLNRWYINTHEQKFSKKIYNIWLKGNISKFTFFMRLKNMCNISKKQMIGKEMKHFLKTVCDKFDKYQEHQVKHKLIQWVQNTRRLRKIEKMFELLTNVTNETENAFERYAVQKILSCCKKRKIVHNYLTKYVKNYVEKRQNALQIWSKVHNLKKEWGKNKLRAILLNITLETTSKLQESMNVFKENRIEGIEQKLKICRRTFNTDTVFLSSFFHKWRFNEKTDKISEEIAISKVMDNKLNSLTKISTLNTKNTDSKVKDIIHKFKLHKEQKMRRINGVKDKFLKIFNKNQEDFLKQTVGIFIDNLNEGITKKQKLVSSLVHANFVKEKVAFSLIRSKVNQMTDMMKVERVTKFYESLQETMQQNMIIFQKDLFVTNILKKIVSNRASNAQLAINYWKTMPLRMRWNMRQKALKLSDTLRNLQIQRLTAVNTHFKNTLVQARLKKKKAVYIMSCKFDVNLQKYFRLYHENVMKIKANHQRKTVMQTFENLTAVTRGNFNIVFAAPSEWNLKDKFIEKMNDHLKQRLKTYFTRWQKNAEALSFYIKLNDEKKNRLLVTINKYMVEKEAKRLRSTIYAFTKNKKIKNLQMHFLNKLTQGKVGKMHKVFTIWKNMPQPQNKKQIVNATNFVNNLFAFRKRNLKYPIKAMREYKRQGQMKKFQSINKLVAVKCGDIGRYFHKWLYHKKLIFLNIQGKSVDKFFSNILQHQRKSYALIVKGNEYQNKIKSLQLIESYWNKQKKYCIKRWHQNTNLLKLRDNSRKYLLNFLGNIQKMNENKKISDEVISKFKANRAQKLKYKKQRKVESLLKALEYQDAYKRRMLNETVDKLKYNHITGNFKKNQAFHKFLREKIGNVHNCLAAWNNLAMQAKQSHKQVIVGKNFDSINETLRSHFRLVFSRGKQFMIMKSALDRIFMTQEIKFKGFFNLWRQRLKELKMLAEMDKQTKGVILQKISKILNNTSNAAVADTIKKFHMNFKIQKVQKKFIERLLQTKSGKLVHAFNSWKTIPYNQKLSKFKKYQKFFYDVESFYKGRLKQAQSKFLDSNEDGKLMKKQSILKLFEMTSLGIRRFYNRWTRFTKEKHTLMQVNKTFAAFESIESALSNQYMIVFQDQRAYRIKISAINKLIEASRGTTQNYFTIWRENVRQKILESKFDLEQKKMALSMFARVAGNSETGQVINIINRFKKNASMVRISRNFFNRLMQTKTGKVLKFFQTLKTVPDAKLNQRKKKGIIFESRLHNFLQKRLRFAIIPFKDSSYDANIKKKYCLDRLLRACMGQNKKKFLTWRNVVREGKILKHTSLCESIFSNIENTFRDNFKIINKDTKAEVQKKKNLCRKLVNNSLFVQHHAYLLWKQAYHIDDIKIKEKKSTTQAHLRNLFEVFKEHQNKQTIQAISSFRKVLDAENLIQSHQQKDHLHQKTLAFYKCLKTKEQNHKNIFIGALKQARADFVLAEKSKKILSSFEAILEVNKKNMSYLFKNDQVSFMEKIFTQLYNNQWNNMRKALSMWQEKKCFLQKVELKQKNTKKQALVKLQTLIVHEENNKKRQIVKKFSEHLNAQLIKKRYLTKLLTRKGNNVRIAYMQWQSIPYQQARKLKEVATNFENKLLQLKLNKLKQIQEIFKSNKISGKVKKQNAARNIVKCKLIDMNTIFFKWRKINNENKIKEKIVSLDKTFAIMHTTFKDNFCIFEDSKIMDHMKIKASTQLFNNNVSRLKDTLNLWRKKTRKIKLTLFEKHMQILIPQNHNRKMLKIAFMMIQKKNELESMKGFINSLWKWKMSNMQATYYSKFIKVFKQSEEMVKFSNVITKKYCEHIHNGFRNILAAGEERTNRKRQIVEKYLTKRMRNYFIQFKNATSKTQINVWKSKYTNSIKAKISYDIFSTLILKSKNDAMSKLKGYYDYTLKVDLFQEKCEKYLQMQMNDSFDKIKWTSQKNLFGLLARLEEKSKKITLKQNYDVLNNYRKLGKLQELFSRTIYRSLMSHGFNRINQRKQRLIKGKLSIILLNTLIKHNMNRQKREIVHKFAKNRNRHLGAEKISKFYLSKQEAYGKELFDQSKNIVNMNNLLLRFKRGLALQKIIEKQDKQLRSKYLNKMRKKENKWMELAIQKFATRASIRSSPAVGLWRLKTFVTNS